MSGIFGIFNRNGEPVSPEIVQKMLDSMSYWDPDDRGTWINGSVALGHTMLWNTPESKLEHLPNQKDHLNITMDARLDNREELADQLKLTDRPIEQITDSTFIVEAYRKWGEGCPKHLLGDFAFAIWDNKKQQLFCARDHIGIKPLYYHVNNDTFVFSTDLRSILSHHNVEKTLSDDSVAMYLSSGELIHPLRTFYKDIIKLPPATTLKISSKLKSYNKYWDPKKSKPIYYDTLEGYASHLRILIEEAIRTRIKSDYPIASHLSGGLDSSSIAVIASRILKSQKRNLLTFNWVQAPEKGDDPDYYEWGNSQKIAEEEGLELYHVDISTDSFIQLFDQHNILYGDTVDLWQEFSVRNSAQQHGVRTILSGWGGDELITYNGRNYYTVTFWKHSPIKAISELWINSKKFTNPLYNFIRQCSRHFIFPQLPVYMQDVLRKKKWKKKELPTYVNRLFAINVDVTKLPFPKLTYNASQIDLYEYGHIQQRVESWNISGKSNRIEYRYPLLDKRVVEFALSIPVSMFRKNGKTRYLYRHAFFNVLPDIILNKFPPNEIRRVEKSTNIMVEALRLWKNNKANKFLLKDAGNYIDIKRLVNEIEKVCGAGFSEYKLIDRIVLLERILPGIFLTKMRNHDRKR